MENILISVARYPRSLLNCKSKDLDLSNNRSRAQRRSTGVMQLSSSLSFSSIDKPMEGSIGMGANNGEDPSVVVGTTRRAPVPGSKRTLLPLEESES